MPHTYFIGFLKCFMRTISEIITHKITNYLISRTYQICQFVTFKIRNVRLNFYAAIFVHVAANEIVSITGNKYTTI